MQGRYQSAPGELKQMRIGPTQRAVVIATRYREQFELSLPAPPSAEAGSLELTGAAGRGFALEILDANKEWHKFQCSDGEVLNATSFCSTRFGNASVALSESLASKGEQKVRLEVLDRHSLGENEELLEGSEIVISASELTNSLPKGFKAGDGLDVFV